VGLYADPRRTKECWASRRPLDDCADPQSPGAPAGAGTADLVANVSSSALGYDRGADFFTTEVWTWRGLVTYYTVFVIDLASRRVQIVGSTPHPGDLFMCQVGRTVTAVENGLLRDHRVLICDRDRKWSAEVQRLLNDAGLRVVQTPLQAPNANAYAERFVRSIKEECLDRIIPIGERHFRGAIREFVGHYHHERNHQALGNALIDGVVPPQTGRRIRRRPRLGGLLNYYERAA
jgi:transposase InsO family protein